MQENTSLAGEHIFDRVCRKHDIQHRLTKINHLWINGLDQWSGRTHEPHHQGGDGQTVLL